VTRSDADLWIGYPGVQSLDLGRPIAADADLFAWMQPEVRRVEPFLWGSGEWRTEHQGMVNVYIVGIDPAAQAMALAGALSPEARTALAEPGAVLIDGSDENKLESGVGQTAEINGHRIRVVGLTRGLRGLGGVNAITSVATARWLDPAAGPGGRVAYVLAKLDRPDSARKVAAALTRTGAGRGFEALTRDAFAARTTAYWLTESGAGTAFIVGSVVAVLVSVVITSQTLAAAVAGSIKEYAALRALGFTMGGLRSVVLAQSAGVGIGGVIVAGLLTLVFAIAARAYGVPIVLSLPMSLAAAGVVVAVALGSGALALGRVARADPATLLL
jgi:putative ABC transport system permease protein